MNSLATPTGRPDLSIIIVSYNTAALLEKCLAAIYANPHPHYTFEVIIVDNASSDHSRAVAGEGFPQARLIANPQNRGFAAATNQGLEQAQGRTLLLLNPDTEVINGAIWQLLAFLEARPEAAVAGPALLYPDGGFQESAFRFPGLGQIFFDFFPLNWRLTRSRLNGRYPRRLFQGEFPLAFEIDFPLGACLMLKRSVLEQVGPLDPAFFMYMEEIDWCYRIKQARQPGSKRANWKIFCLPAARVIHHAGASTRQFRAEMQYQLFKSRAYFYRKHQGRVFWQAARLITRLGLAWRGLAALSDRAAGRLDNHELAARLKTYRRIWRLY